jgi:hypothetical protein
MVPAAMPRGGEQKLSAFKVSARLPISIHQGMIHSTNELRAGANGDNRKQSPLEIISAFVNKNFFLVGMFIAVSLAKVVPSVSSKHLRKGSCHTRHIRSETSTRFVGYSLV